MKNTGTLSELIEKYKNYPGRVFGGLFTTIKKNKKLLDELKLITSFLDTKYTDISIQQRFYHVWFNKLELEICPYCDNHKKFSKLNKFSIDRYGKNSTNQSNYYGTCRIEKCAKQYNVDRTKIALIEKYGVENPSQIEGWLDKVKLTNIKKFGSEWYMQTKEFATAVENTSIKKRGVKHHTQDSSVQDKKVKTVQAKYGVNHVLNDPTILKKLQNTNLSRYGNVSSMGNSDVQIKSKNTMRARYGVDWYTYTDEIKLAVRNKNIELYGVPVRLWNAQEMDKNMKLLHAWKKYVFPSGRLENVQGYEPFALNDLLLSHCEEDIVCTHKLMEPLISKIFYITNDNKPHRYFPDIFIISENKVIEVKSEYTLLKNKDTNLAKRQAVLDKGLLFEFWVYDTKGNRRIE